MPWYRTCLTAWTRQDIIITLIVIPEIHIIIIMILELIIIIIILIIEAIIIILMIDSRSHHACNHANFQAREELDTTTSREVNPRWKKQTI